MAGKKDEWLEDFKSTSHSGWWAKKLISISCVCVLRAYKMCFLLLAVLGRGCTFELTGGGSLVYKPCCSLLCRRCGGLPFLVPKWPQAGL